MIYSAGDLGVQIDLGPDTPGMILQRREPDGWQDYRPDGEQVVSPVDIEALPPGVLPAGGIRVIKSSSAEPGPRCK